MKKLMGILLAASMVFSLAACGSTADTDVYKRQLYCE